ncbi:MAG: hypothetical protein ACF8LK_06775 [Phycisphaerales bacterium JB041]
MSMFKKAVVVAALCAGAAVAGPDQAPGVSYTVSGTPGAYELNFRVGASFDDGMNVYFFGVAVDTGRDIIGSPAGWDPNSWLSWDNSSYGGSATQYNNVWISPNEAIFDGQAQAGFRVRYTGASAPVSVDWFAFAAGGSYTGTDPFFNNPSNPGFEGTAVVPAPGVPAMLGVAAVAALRRRR